MSRINVVVLALLMAVALSGAAQVPVSMIDFAFSPDTVRVSPGDSVVWTNNGALLHTSTSGVNGVWDSLWDSGNMAHGATFVHGFVADGTFDYFCRHHYLGGMKGVVVVGTGGVNEMPGTDGSVASVASFPNPSRHGTTIRYLLAKPGLVTISVVDVAGRTVAQLLTASQGAGSHEVSWNGRTIGGKSVAAGVYLVQIEASGVHSTTRLVLSH
jgi:plastocyanin